MEVALRRATHADYDAVMAINDNVYDGFDYLLSSYHALLDARNSKAFLCEHNGEVIGFIIGWLVDDDRTVVVRAGRVTTEHDGKGVYRRLINHLFAAYAEMPGVVTEAITITDWNKKKYGNYFQNTYKELLQRECAQYTVRVADIEQRVRIVGVNAEPITVDGELLKKIFSSEDLCKVWFPEDRIVLSWVPYQLVESNIEHITGHKANILADYQTMTDDKMSKPGLLTLGGPYKCPTSLLYFIAVCGTDPSTLANHVATHLRHAMQLTSGDITLHFYFETRFPISVLDEVLAMFGSKQNDVYYKMMYLCEKNI